MKRVAAAFVHFGRAWPNHPAGSGRVVTATINGSSDFQGRPAL